MGPWPPLPILSPLLRVLGAVAQVFGGHLGLVPIGSPQPHIPSPGNYIFLTSRSRRGFFLGVVPAVLGAAQGTAPRGTQSDADGPRHGAVPHICHGTRFTNVLSTLKLGC